MSITNVSKPSTTLTNVTKVSFAETWGAITTTWASETRVWFETSSIIENAEFADLFIWSTHTYPWRESLPWQLAGTGITNISKP